MLILTLQEIIESDVDTGPTADEASTIPHNIDVKGFFPEEITNALNEHFAKSNLPLKVGNESVCLYGVDQAALESGLEDTYKTIRDIAQSKKTLVFLPDGDSRSKVKHLSRVLRYDRVPTYSSLNTLLEAL